MYGGHISNIMKSEQADATAFFALQCVSLESSLPVACFKPYFKDTIRGPKG